LNDAAERDFEAWLHTGGELTPPVLLAFWQGVFEPEQGTGWVAQTLPFPFEPVLRPLIDETQRPLARIADAYPWVRGALEGLQESLLARLSAIANLPIALWLRSHPRPRSAVHGWDEVVPEYPELTRLVELLQQQWVVFAGEFLQRLIDDRVALTAFMGVANLTVESVSGGCSDPHDGGRAVIQVNFTGGMRLAYKPRPLQTESVYARLCQALAESGPTLPAADVLAREDYGWMAWIKPAPTADAQAWYQTAGGLQSLLQAIGLRDAHFANCIAAAGGPVLIDCECLLTPGAVSATHAWQAPGEGTELDAVVAELQSTSYLIDPLRHPGEPDVSGLFGRGGQFVGCRIPVWLRGEDQPVLAFSDARLCEQANQLAEGSSPLPKMAARAAFVEGFQRMHRHIAEERDSLLRELAALEDAPVRVLLRSTRRYTKILSDSIHPRLLRDANLRRQAIVEWLAADEPTWNWKPAPVILAAELASLERLDVPVFHAFGLDLCCGAECLVPHFFMDSGFAACQDRLQGWASEPSPLMLQALQLLWMMAL
jgi:lantibiotic modifying enzyme